MELFPWEDRYGVGIEKIDNQHRKLVGILNMLYEEMQQGTGHEALGLALDNLVQYTNEHFLSEESMMKLYEYPDYPMHKEKHESMKKHVLKLAEQYRAGAVKSPIQITNFLKDWLKKHILETDKKYGPFLKDKGAQ